jgi:hypothetical protein
MLASAKTAGPQKDEVQPIGSISNVPAKKN